MHSPHSPRPPNPRDVLYFSDPRLWPTWPVLPVIRRRPDQAPELGVMIDLWHRDGVPGYSATVFLANAFLLPLSLPGVLALPREVFDSAEEVARAGWTVD